MLDLSLSGDVDLFSRLPVVNKEALRQAVNNSSADCKRAVYDEMRRVFDRPTRYTLNSLTSTASKGSELTAYVWFKDPDRMGKHYLVPQVEGGPRQLKGFERALDGKMFIPGRGARMDKHGNVSAGQIRQLLSVLGRAERYAGYTANISARSKLRNKKERDYTYLPYGMGKMFPGVYQRVAKGGKASKPGNYRAGQQGRRKGSVAMATGMVPVLLVGRQFSPYKVRLDFYGICRSVFTEKIGSLYVAALQVLFG
jgi:hypothetical protein